MRNSRWVKSAAIATLAASTTVSATTVPSELHKLAVQEAAKLICSRSITSRQLLEVYLQRIDSRPQLNSFISVDAKGALAKADAYDQRLADGGYCLPLGGVPIAVKDNIQVKGMVNSAGTPALKNFIPSLNAPIIDRLETAGAIIIGKTNMHELAYGASGYNTAFHYPGVVGVRNAFQPDRIAGGSSSGSASAVGAHLISAALGTDTGGSIRQPCALNGCVGFRPSIGRYSTEGIVPISPTRDTPGPMARSVEDVILLDRILSGQTAGHKRAFASIRLGVVEEFWADLSPEVEAQTRSALTVLQQAGVKIINVSLPNMHALNDRVSMPIALYEGRDALSEYLEHSGSRVTLAALVTEISSPDVKTIFEQFIMPRKLPTANGQLEDLVPAYRWAVDVGRPKMLHDYRALFKKYGLNALVFPTTPEVAIVSAPEAASFSAFSRMIRNTDPGSNVGLPGISMPVGLVGTPALPVGLEIDGLPGEDDDLLAIAKTLQEILRN